MTASASESKFYEFTRELVVALERLETAFEERGIFP